MKPFTLLLLLLLSVQSQATTLQCAVQLARADQRLYQKLPIDTFFQSALMHPLANERHTGSMDFLFPAMQTTSPLGYLVRIQAQFSPVGSRWNEKNKVFDVTTTLLDATGKQVLAMAQDHSDRLYTPLMLNLVKANKPRFIGRTWNPEVMQKLVSSKDPRVAHLVEVGDPDRATQQAILEGEIDPQLAKWIDVICEVDESSETN